MQTFEQFLKENQKPPASIKDLVIYPIIRKYRVLLNRINDIEIQPLLNYINILNQIPDIQPRQSLAMYFFQNIQNLYLTDLYMRNILKHNQYSKKTLKDVLNEFPITPNLTTVDEIMEEFERIYDGNSPIRIFSAWMDNVIYSYGLKAEMEKYSQRTKNNKIVWKQKNANI